MDRQSLRLAIMNGDVDDSLDLIPDYVMDRKKLLGQMLFEDLEEGDRIKVRAPKLKPRYLNGATGTVMEKRISKITVKFDDGITDPYGKWAGKHCILDPWMIVKEG